MTTKTHTAITFSRQRALSIEKISSSSVILVLVSKSLYYDLLPAVGTPNCFLMWILMHLSIVLNSAEILVLGPHLCTSIQVRAMIGLLKKPFSVVLPIKMRGKLKTSFGNSLSLLGSQNTSASQTLLTVVKLRL